MGGVAVDVGAPGVKAPDGGWGWAVLAGCFVITGFSYAFPKAVSVFFKELIREFDVGYSDTAWISSILLAMLYGTGPVCSVLVNRFGCRPVMMVGGLFASLGMILASFSTSIIHIYLCTGVITGLGLSLNFQPSLIMLNRYFSEKRPLANGLSAAGSPVALCCLSPLGQVLQYQYGWRGGFLILGGLLLNCCVCGALMKPLVAPKSKELEERHDKELEGIEIKKKAKPKLLDFSVFKDRGFVIYTVAASIMVLGLFVPPVFVVSYAKELGNEDTKSALLLTILGFIDIFARPTCGVIAGLKWVRPRCVYFFSFAMLFNGIADLIGSQSKDYSALVVFCIFFGISYGMVGALQFEVLMTIVGTEKFSSAIGLVLLMEAIAVLVGPPGAGRLLDATKNYMYVFLLAGCEVVVSAVVLATCNFLFIKIKPSAPADTLESIALTDECNTKMCGNRADGKDDDEKGEMEEPEKATNEEENKDIEGIDDVRPKSVTVDSQEVERFLKEPEPNGNMAACPETCL
ncbi:monocarboxylate transporter 4 [Fundulus heteroclitus]|uniref:monocarboxylate transporter 4 n=1 Tax=Fundulus heteroclitus TaxID=8078 RepID=UPI00165A9634|nr:monocarboxylate transporter 4 [Fundulus heteroclitus]XP_021163195.2 monocarboxylate transporter 4 [Fundulus heteroclitus]XP_035985331.1 monocarboxylate transporter 4 [Fundulus heteroclitus]XP_035985332.1 monocarboxylate transporter 4 [Fundulus heteroclitus]